MLLADFGTSYCKILDTDEEGAAQDCRHPGT